MINPCANSNAAGKLNVNTKAQVHRLRIVSYCKKWRIVENLGVQAKLHGCSSSWHVLCWFWCDLRAIEKFFLTIFAKRAKLNCI